MACRVLGRRDLGRMLATACPSHRKGLVGGGHPTHNTLELTYFTGACALLHRQARAKGGLAPLGQGVQLTSFIIAFTGLGRLRAESRGQAIGIRVEMGLCACAGVSLIVRGAMHGKR